MSGGLSYCKIDGYDMIFLHDTREWWSTNAKLEKKVQDFSNSLYNIRTLNNLENGVLVYKYGFGSSEWLFEAIAERFGATDTSHYKDSE